MIEINNLAWVKRSDGSRQGEIVAGTDHRTNPFVPLLPLGGRICERTDPPAPGKAKRRLDGLAVGVSIGIDAVVLIDAGDPKLLRQPLLPITARAQGSRLAKRVACIVDITEFGEPVREGFEIGFPLLSPAAFAQLPAKVGAQLRPCRRIFSDIPERELLQRGLFQRRLGSLAFG